MNCKFLLKLFFISIVSLLITSSKVTAQQQEKFQDGVFIHNVSSFLIKNLKNTDNKQRELFEAYYLQLANTHLFLRIPFKNKPITTDFIAVEIDSVGNCYRGSIVHINMSTKNYTHLDTVIIYTLNREKNWIIHTAIPSGKNQVKVALDPVIIHRYDNNDITKPFLLLNTTALLNPAKIALTENEDGFGIAPAGKTSGDFGTYSFYMNAALNRDNFLPPVAEKIAFEQP